MARQERSAPVSAKPDCAPSPPGSASLSRRLAFATPVPTDIADCPGPLGPPGSFCRGRVPGTTRPGGCATPSGAAASGRATDRAERPRPAKESTPGRTSHPLDQACCHAASPRPRRALKTQQDRWLARQILEPAERDSEPACFQQTPWPGQFLASSHRDQRPQHRARRGRALWLVRGRESLRPVVQ